MRSAGKGASSASRSPVSRVVDFKACRVEEVPREQRRLSAVERVADDWAPDRGEVRPYLVGAAGDGADLQERCAIVGGGGAVAGDRPHVRRRRARCACGDGGVAAQRRVDAGPRTVLGRPFTKRQIHLRHGASFELAGEGTVRGRRSWLRRSGRRCPCRGGGRCRGARRRRCPRGRGSAPAGRGPACRGDGQGAGVHRHARRLVDDDQVGVFVDDGEADGLRCQVEAFGGGG